MLAIRVVDMVSLSPDFGFQTVLYLTALFLLNHFQSVLLILFALANLSCVSPRLRQYFSTYCKWF